MADLNNLGCLDGSCPFRVATGGMTTNGGCSCIGYHLTPVERGRLSGWVRQLRDRVRELEGEAQAGAADREEAWRDMCDLRGVETPCPKCQGYGVRAYGSTATWRGGIGGQSITNGVCDACWGSGDANRQWANLRKLESERVAMSDRECAEWLARKCGASYSRMRESLARFADVIEAEGRRRKVPAGVDLFWYSRAAEAVAGALRSLAKEPTGSAAIASESSKWSKALRDLVEDIDEATRYAPAVPVAVAFKRTNCPKCEEHPEELVIMCPRHKAEAALAGEPEVVP